MCLTQRASHGYQTASAQLLSGCCESAVHVGSLMVEKEWTARKCFSYGDLTVLAVATEYDRNAGEPLIGNSAAANSMSRFGSAMKRSKSEHNITDAVAAVVDDNNVCRAQENPVWVAETGSQASKSSSSGSTVEGSHCDSDDVDGKSCSSDCSASSCLGAECVHDMDEDQEYRCVAAADVCCCTPEFSESYDSQASSDVELRSTMSPSAFCVKACEMEVIDEEDEHCKPDESQLKKRSSYHLTHGQAAVELFLRLNHARQTVDFVRRQAQEFGELNKAEMSVWEALNQLNELRDYESALFSFEGTDPDMSLMEHAFQTAELCRLKHPDKDWLHLVGLLHGLGKLLAHRRFGAQPQWAVCGETFPVGCRFAPQIAGSQFFSVNPDRRRRAYNTPLGIYRAGCGLRNVCFSWSACEYLYLVLMLNGTDLPDEGLFLIRHQKFHSITKPGCTYQGLLSLKDQNVLPLLASFQSLAAYKRVHLPDEALRGEAFYEYYDRLIKKYICHERLFW